MLGLYGGGGGILRFPPNEHRVEPRGDIHEKSSPEGTRSSQPPPSKDGQGSKKTEETSGTRARKSGIKMAPD